MNLQEYYSHALVSRGFVPDLAQEVAILRLQKVLEEWVSYEAKKKNLLKKILSKLEVPRGLYLWGGVGRGKSFVMDSFFAVVPVKRKVRWHFHEFMRNVHRELDQLRGVENAVDVLAAKIAKEYQLICFDEFHVNDIADAMVLYNLLEALFKRGVSFVMTSNYAPETLYQDGLNRHRFLPAITLLKQKLDIMNMDGGTDYRCRAMESVSAYYTPLSLEVDIELTQTYVRLAGAALEESPVLEIEGRRIRALRRAGEVIWFDFATLCGGPRSQNDYLELVRCFHTVILSNVPRLSASMASEARRFTWLIDVFYDNKIKLIMSAEVPPEMLYVKGQLANEFHRTVSRIREMQTQEYMQLEKRNHDV
jgi:cell division protein ZapE